MSPSTTSNTASKLTTRFVISGIFAGMIFVILAFSLHSWADMILSCIFTICAILSISIPSRKKTYQTSDKIIKIKQVSFPTISTLFVFLESKIILLRRIRIWNQGIIEGLIPKAGAPYDAEKQATLATRMAILTIPVVILFILYFTDLGVWIVLVGIIPGLIFFRPYLREKLTILERKTKIEEEMAYFLSYIHVMQVTGVGLYQSFVSICGKGIFPAMGQDAVEILKRVELLQMTQEDSLDVYAKNHPSKNFAGFVRGYLAKLSIVGHVPEYTRTKAEYFYDDYIASWARYAKSANEVFGTMLLVAFMPAMLVAFSSVTGMGDSTNMVLILGVLLPPIAAGFLIARLNSSQPATGADMKISRTILLAIPVGLVAYLAGLGLATSAALAAVLGSMVGYLYSRKAFSMLKSTDDIMPEFMADISEMSRTGKNVNQIIREQSAKKPYNTAMNTLLDKISSNMASGATFGDAAVPAKRYSTFVKFIMFLLGRIYETGGGTAELFHTMTAFVTKIHQAKKHVTQNLSMLTGIVYVMPFLMLGMTHVMVSMISGLDSNHSAPLPINLELGQVNDDILDAISLMAIVTSVSMGVVASKMKSYTIKDMFPVMLCSISAIIAIHVAPKIVKMLDIPGIAGI